MKHFITFQKKKAFFIREEAKINKDTDAVFLPEAIVQNDSTRMAMQLNHELMAVGYVLSKDAFDALSRISNELIQEIYSDTVKGIKEIVGGSGYEPIYRNFPQSVENMSYMEFARNAILHYWSFGAWRPNDADYIKREFKIEPVKYKIVGLIDEKQFNAIFTNLLYSKNSLSKFDKECIDWYLDNNGPFDYNSITYNEIAAYVGKRLLSDKNIVKIPTRKATSVLRLWAAYSGGDEGLKENTKFKNPNKKQRNILLNTLENCVDLEDSFKAYREMWLRFLFYLHPMTPVNKQKYPELSNMTYLLRNKPKELKTFNSRVEEAIAKGDTAVFQLLKKRPGMFMRRLDHLVRTFGYDAFKEWISIPNLTKISLINAYNHFVNRDKNQDGRGSILAGSGSSNVVTYDSLAPIDTKLVSSICGEILNRLREGKKEAKVYIDPQLYFTPITMNNRASSLNLSGSGTGRTEVYDRNETLRMYVHWEGSSDIDLSGFIINKDNSVTKVGWNGRHAYQGFVTYSGDNTGYSAKNAEYLDINTNKIPSDVEWIISEARIFRGPSNFAGYNGKCHIGWMSRNAPKANSHWLPETIQEASVLKNKGKNAYLMAYHPDSKNIVYLDVAMGNNQVSTEADVLKMRTFLKTFIVLNDANNEITWERINLGHILNVSYSEVVTSKEEADIVYDEQTNQEDILSIIE